MQQNFASSRLLKKFRQVSYHLDGINVYHHSDVGVSAIILMWNIDGVFQKSGTLFPEINDNVTSFSGVQWQGVRMMMK
jgi:hypothetical protein